jgi:L-rhamnose mutarotase
MFRKAFVMSVIPDKHEEYKQRHDNLWPEMHSLLKSHGVHNYSIFLNPETSQLFAYVELESEEQWNSIAETDACKKWWVYMKDIMPSNTDNSPQSVELQEVFHLA